MSYHKSILISVSVVIREGHMNTSGSGVSSIMFYSWILILTAIKTVRRISFFWIEESISPE